jgi:YggT family protein
LGRAEYVGDGHTSQEAGRCDRYGPPDGHLPRGGAPARVSPNRAATTDAGKPMRSILTIIDIVLNLYMWCLIITAILSWLSYGGVLNTRNRFVYAISDFLYRITEPALRPIRRVVPTVGGIDLSPLVLILVIHLLRMLLQEYGGLLV